ncbi:UDP-2,3-diacylglucosamine diphosphatase [Pararhodonellum marinum]|uniref:UDP-2,3-diacylglucosamine diphosphatase n=1 Tax=Pararhodonellum marinum TaxID=2755358 RepID=UPI00189043F8|nr:UDP-2,3-diacylglucosamine diphosphatase [Pararhodonellum marinum]
MKITLRDQQKIYFASDFHLGAPDEDSSRKREEKIIRWLSEIEVDAAAIFLVGDIFDFWFEYDKVIPKGFMRFLGKITALRTKGIPIFFFTGNHDLWMKDYFTKELSIPVFQQPLELEINSKKFLVGHGDGLGPGDEQYKLLKQVFTNSVAQWIFKWLHPDVGMRLAHLWSKNSRIANDKKKEAEFKGDEEWLWQYCQKLDLQYEFDYYVFGHRHLPLELKVGKKATYVNLGEWVHACTYGVFDGKSLTLTKYHG